MTSMTVAPKRASGDDIEERFLTASGIIVTVFPVFGDETLIRLSLWHKGFWEVSCTSIIEADADRNGLSENVDSEGLVLNDCFREDEEFFY